MKSILLIATILLSLNCQVFSQTESVLRLNVINPAISYEKALGSKTSLDASLGFGYNFSYPNLSLAADDGFQYIVCPFCGCSGSVLL